MKKIIIFLVAYSVIFSSTTSAYAYYGTIPDPKISLGFVTWPSVNKVCTDNAYPDPLAYCIFYKIDRHFAVNEEGNLNIKIEFPENHDYDYESTVYGAGEPNGYWLYPTRQSWRVSGVGSEPVPTYGIYSVHINGCCDGTAGPGGTRDVSMQGTAYRNDYFLAAVSTVDFTTAQTFTFAITCAMVLWFVVTICQYASKKIKQKRKKPGTI